MNRQGAFISDFKLSQLLRAAKALFLLLSAFFFLAAMSEYKGEYYVYILFTLLSYGLLYFGFRQNAIFFDAFISVFFWLGFWLKLTIRVAFVDGNFHEPVGMFDGSGDAFDRGLLVASCGFLGLILASYIREKYIFLYPKEIAKITQVGLFDFYYKYRGFVLSGFVLLAIFVAVSNIYLGIYQKGVIPSTYLPYGLNGVYKWLLLFGLASISAVILRFEMALNKKALFLGAALGLMESFLSSVSLLSRGMVLNVSALVYGVLRSVGSSRREIGSKFVVTILVLLVLLFGFSVVAVNYVRAVNYGANEVAVWETDRNDTAVLFLDRWVGIEGVLAVSSYSGLGEKLWKKAWAEKYSENETTFYDNVIITSPYKNLDKSKHHFVSMPGVLAFFFYPGSYVVLFMCMFFLGIAASLIEKLVFYLGGKNVILCSLLGQIVAYRFANSGYVPAQSYLLFGSLVLNVVMIYGVSKVLDFYSTQKESIECNGIICRVFRLKK